MKILNVPLTARAILVAGFVVLCCSWPVSAGGPMKMATGWSDERDEGKAIQEALAAMNKGLGNDVPKLVTVFVTGHKYDHRKVFASLRRSLKPGTKIWGLNSDMGGVVLPDGVHTGLAVTGFSSPNMSVGVGKVNIKWDNPASHREAGRRVIVSALKDAGKTSGQVPSVILFAGLNLVTDTDLYGGMEDTVGKVPVWGGNAGQESGQGAPPGDGWCYYNTGVGTACISVAALWLDTKVGLAYGCGYSEDSRYKGVVTKADVNKRLIYEIDHLPAADVYNKWTGGKIDAIIENGGGAIPMSIVGKYGVKKPLGKGEFDYVWVGFPFVYADKSLFVTHEPVEEGTELTLMELKDEKEIVNKPVSVATVARVREDIPKQDVAGALILYCYAQYYVAKEQGFDINVTFPLLSSGLNGATYSGFLAGGEIGYLPQGGNRMMACSSVVIVFGKK